MNNYRPISNLPFMSKLVEKCMLVQFNKHCEDNQLMPDYQSAYRSNYSCETSLVKLVNDILCDFENQNAVALVALEFSAAFNTVDHEVLLDVLSTSLGVTGSAYNWHSSYLRPKSCLVEIENSRSSERSLEFSVLQGSCGGPVLYSVYASSLQTEISVSVRLNAFADDHSLNYAFKANNREQEVETMNCLEKCKHQIDMKCHTAMFNLQKIRRISPVLTMDACWTLVFGLVTSHVDYANALYIGLPDCDIAKHQHVQNAAVKLVLNKTKYDSATEALKELHWLPIRFRIIHKLLTLVHKSLKGNAAKYLQELLHKHQPGRDGLRSSNDPGIALTGQRTKCKTFGDRSFTVAGPRLWNSLPHNIRSIDNLDSFKTKLKTHLFMKAFN